MSVISLSEVRGGDTQLVGGKAANLGELINGGFPIPPGFVVTSNAYASIYHDLGIAEDILNIERLSPSEQETIALKIREKIEALPFPEKLKQEITEAHNQIQSEYEQPLVYAVRSSATAEDLADASFAGQHDTYYYVNSESLIEMIQKCWGSLWSNAAISYRSSQGISHGTVRMAAVVQVMVRSDVSGVTFTANPVTGNRDQIISESTWGMGAAIVDGRVTPDRFVVERNTQAITERHIANKAFMVPAEPEDLEGPRLLEVSQGLRQRESLSAEKLLLVTEWAARSEQHFGNPQDIEWSFEGDVFYMLQSRPITVLGEANRSHDFEGQYVLFKAIAENFTSPIYPLTADLIVNPLPMMEMINSRVYLKLSALKPLFPIHISERQIADLAYLSGNDTIEFKIAWTKLPAFFLILIANYLISEVIYRRIANMPDDFMEGFRKVIGHIDSSPEIQADEVVDRILGTRFFEPVGNMVYLVNIISASRYPVFLALFSKLLRRWLPELRPDAESMLCSGSEGVLSTDMGRQIWQIANLAKQNQALKALILNEPPESALNKMVGFAGASDFINALNEFKRIHGHRTLKEFELQSTRWEEDPSPVIGMVRNYLLADSDPELIEARIQENRTDLEFEVKNSLQDLWLEKQTSWRWRLLDYLRSRAKYFIKLRENSRFYHIMTFYLLRKKIIRDEQQLMASGSLKCKDDIFYLTGNELSRLKSGYWSWLDVEDIIRERRMEQIRLSKITPPRTVGIQEDEATDGETDNAYDSHSLSGQGASPGVYVGIARVILDPAIDPEIRPGEILIAPYTDPAWTPLFLIAHAAVVEVGSYLSHAGTIAREYGMPCVVDVENCTGRIRTGDRIRVNGTLGLVEFAHVDTDT
jgi:pyruvate,water dikinase